MPERPDLELSGEFLDARLQLARLQLSGPESMERAYTEVTELSAQVMEVERVGVWLLEQDGAALRCVHLYERSTGRHGPAEVLRPVDFPTYVAALHVHRAVQIDDVRTSKHTAELQGYLREHAISSMLDAPLFRDGQVVGVVCHEHVGPQRHWTGRERDFAISVTEVLALLLEKGDRVAAERVAHEAERRQQEHQRLVAMGRMARAVAHDFNNTLAVLSLTAERVQRLRPDDSLVVHSMRLIGEAARRSTGYIQQLLAFGRDEPTVPQTVPLSAWLERARHLLESVLGEASTLTIEPVDPSLALWVDPTDLERVVLNLVTNARDAMSKGGTLTLRAGPCALPSGKRAVALELHDTGSGMEPSTLARLFEPFFTTKGEGKGNGLGLVIVRQLVEHSGGTVSVRSLAGQGTTFTVALPSEP